MKIDEQLKLAWYAGGNWGDLYRSHIKITGKFALPFADYKTKREQWEQLLEEDDGLTVDRKKRELEAALGL